MLVIFKILDELGVPNPLGEWGNRKVKRYYITRSIGHQYLPKHVTGVMGIQGITAGS
jgi:hypothetical protein